MATTRTFAGSPRPRPCQIAATRKKPFSPDRHPRGAGRRRTTTRRSDREPLRAEENRWHVGLLEWYTPTENEATLTYLVIHPTSGEIEDRVSRLWDEATDGWP